MNTHITTHNAKIWHLCSCLFLCLHLVSASIPGPCQHSITEEHLLILKKLIINQVKNGCLISFTFTERQHLSEVCYIKAAFPHILDLLSTHFTYEKGSDNYRYTSSLVNRIYDIYSQKCIPPINEELEENPVMFARQYIALPREALLKIEEIFHMYKRLMSENDKPVDWNCENDYSKNVPESTTALYSKTTGTPACQCPCPHHMKEFFSTEIASTVSTSPHTQSGLPDKDKIPNSTPNQISAISPGSSLFPGLHNKTSLVFTDQHFAAGHEESRTTPNLMDNSINSSVPMGPVPQAVTSPPIASAIKSASIPTRSVLQSATSQPSEKFNTTSTSDGIPVFILAKRSLNNREQKPGSFFRVQSNKSKGVRKNKRAELLKIMSGETENSSIKHDKHRSPTQVQMDLHTAKDLPRNVFKNDSKEPDCKGSSCGKRTEDISDQNTEYHVKKEPQLLHISVNTMLLIPTACLFLLFIPVLFYGKQKQVKVSACVTMA